MERVRKITQHVTAGTSSLPLAENGEVNLALSVIGEELSALLPAGHAARVAADTETIKAGIHKSAHPTMDALGDAMAGRHSSLDLTQDYLAEFSPQERLLRIELAAAYRWIAKMGWSDTINNHISAKIPGTEHFLLNPYGVGYDEITASGLVKVDINGDVLHPGYADQAYCRGHVNKAGFIIHSAVHGGRPDVHCCLHTHEENVVAVSCQAEGLLPVGQAFYALRDIKYHDYEGIAVSPDERVSLLQDLGPTSMVMFLRNHGSLVCGRSIAECIINTYYLHKCCNMQVKAAACAALSKSPLILPSPQVVQTAFNQASNFETKDGQGAASRKSEVYGKEWIYHVRRMIREDASFVR